MTGSERQGALAPPETYRVTIVTERAIEAFGNEEQARKWLTKPNRALGGILPLHRLTTDADMTLVMEELGRIETGDLF